MTDGGSRRSLGAMMRSGTSIAVAMAVMNVSTYAYTMIAARVLGPTSYGALASLLATLLVVGVLQLGLQATGARRIAADPVHTAQIEHTILRVTLRAAFALGALLLLLTPVINLVLRLDHLPTAALVGVAAVPMTIMGGQVGILQGERRWWPLAVVYVASGVPRLIIGTGLILWHPSVFEAMLGVTIGAMAPVLVGAFALRYRRHPVQRDDSHGAWLMIRETVHNSQALLAFFALSNADVIVARNVLDDHDAGLYAGGLILTKAVLFLPQFVVVVAFPAMSTARERTRALQRSLSAVAALGACAIGGALLLPDLAMIFVGGDKYAEIEPRLWLFALIGTLLSMLQLLVYSVLARQGQHSVYVVWAALAAVVAAGLLASTVWELLLLVLVVDTVLFLALLAASVVVVRRENERVTASS